VPEPAPATPQLLALKPAAEGSLLGNEAKAQPAPEPAPEAAPAPTLLDAFMKAEGRDARLAAWNALSKDEQKAAWEDVPEEARKELGLVDPARPVYGEFKLPDGFKPDDAALKSATELFADSGLSQEQAQKFIDLAASREKAASEAGTRAFVELQSKWVSEIKADPHIGGDKLGASLASAATAIDRLAIPGLREALDLTGAGNNPAIVKAFVRLGQMMTEDRFVPGNGAPPGAPRSPAEAIYGSDGPRQSAG
jgi:hypothetical protein